ncbi:hypothetical protein LCGC14_1810250 [marine sediment metagenome]|uniref:Uncharacterized protein n=1 Tax=marine sediment metagenome TaxID=412755 RepID=A0A0F9CSR8_9ZZZZ
MKKENGKQKCKERVWNRWKHFRCSRYAVKDEYCKQHHPDEVEKRRKISAKGFQRELDNSPWRKLEKANVKIKELEEEIGILKSQLVICSYDPKRHHLYIEDRKRQIKGGVVE